MKYTNGPWKLGGEANKLISKESFLKGFRLINAPSHTAMAMVIWKMENVDRSIEKENNGRLMCAAPDLYEALKATVPPYPSSEAKCHYGVCRQEHCFHCQAILSAHKLLEKLEKESK